MTQHNAYDARARLAASFARARGAAIPIAKIADDIGAQLPSTSPDHRYVEARLAAYKEASNGLDG